MKALRSAPGFTLTVIGVLAVAIGANTIMFSVVRAVLLRPVPWENPERLALLEEMNPRQGGSTISPSTANYKDWREQSGTFERMAAFRFVYFNLADRRAEPERVQGLKVSADFFPLIGVSPARGRNLQPDDEQPGSERVVLLSDGFWRRRYAADPKIVGSAIIIEGEPYKVIGVLPDFPMFRVLSRPLEIYTPLALPASALSREDHSIGVYARLRQGFTMAGAQSEMDTIAGRLAAAYPSTNRDWTVKVTPLPQAFTRGRHVLMEVLLAATGFVLLVACANIASLTVARAASRRRELAIRAALGAGRARIVRQLLTESLILALAGGAVGALAAVAGTAYLDRSLTSVGHTTSFRVEWSVLAFATGLSLLAGISFGIGPAIQSSRVEVNRLLSSAGRGATVRDRGGWLVTGEVALATMLLIGAALAARATTRLLRMDRGLDSRNVLTAQLWMPPSRYATAAHQRRFVEESLARVRALPGIRGASVTNYPPLSVVGTAVNFEIEGRPTPASRGALIARFRTIDPDFFRTLRLPLITGRAFEDGDADESRGVTIVSETFAHRFFAGEDAIGKRIRPRFPGGDAYWYPRAANLPLRIVGIARDVRDSDIDTSNTPQIYLPYAQNPSRIVHLLVRTEGNPRDWAAAVRAAILAIDPEEPVFDIRTLDEITAVTFSQQSTFATLLTAAGALALLLAATGIYAVVAWAVTRRTREIGIRIAIGAAPADVARMVLRQALQPASAGVAVGVIGAWALQSVLRAQIYGIEIADPAAFVLPCAIPIVVALAAGFAPAMRAVRVDPVAALRLE